MFWRAASFSLSLSHTHTHTQRPAADQLISGSHKSSSLQQIFLHIT